MSVDTFKRPMCRESAQRNIGLKPVEVGRKGCFGRVRDVWVDHKEGVETSVSVVGTGEEKRRFEGLLSGAEWRVVVGVRNRRQENAYVPGEAK